jgi:hypothetical protein
VKESKPPADLGVEGRRLWRDILRDAAGQGVELTAQELVYLRQAGKLADTIARMEADAAAEPTVVPGYLNRGNVIQPLLPEIRMHRQLLGQMLARVKTDVAEAPGIPAGTGTSNRFRAAAMARWGGA